MATIKVDPKVSTKYLYGTSGGLYVTPVTKPFKIILTNNCFILLETSLTHFFANINISGLHVEIKSRFRHVEFDSAQNASVKYAILKTRQLPQIISVNKYDSISLKTIQSARNLRKFHIAKI